MPVVYRTSHRRYQPEPPPPPPPSPLLPSPPPDQPPFELGAVEAAAIGVEAAAIAVARPPPRSELKSAVSDRFQGWLPSYQFGWYWICEAANAAAKRRLHTISTPRGDRVGEQPFIERRGEVGRVQHAQPIGLRDAKEELETLDLVAALPAFGRRHRQPAAVARPGEGRRGGEAQGDEEPGAAPVGAE